jgi:YVTN family beta-propeller protein
VPLEHGRVTVTAHAYVSNSYGDTVSVIDTATNDVIATIGFGDAPPKPTATADLEGRVDVRHGLVNPTVAPDGQHVYVAKSVGGGIAVIDADSQEVTEVLDAGGPKPSGLAFTPDGKRLVVTLLGETVELPGAVAVIDCGTGQAGTPVPMGGQPERLALSPDGRRAYVVSMHDRSVSVLDVDAHEVVAKVSLGELPFNVLAAPDGERVYVGVLRADHVAVIDTERHEVVDRIDIPSPNGLAFGADRRSIYVTCVFDDSVQVIDLDAGGVVRSADAGEKPGHLALTEDGSRAYIVRPFGDTVSVLDTESLEIVHTIKVDKGPTTVAIRTRIEKEAR